jgi:voltage-gated potassium channel
LDTIAAGSFTSQLAGDFSASLYFSLATITTLGYGDITPIEPFARIWAVLEAVVGLLYVAVLIARLVSDFRR